MYKIEENYTVFSWLLKLTPFVPFSYPGSLAQACSRVKPLSTNTQLFSSKTRSSDLNQKEPEVGSAPFFFDIRSQGGYFISLKLENVLDEGLLNKGGAN